MNALAAAALVILTASVGCARSSGPERAPQAVHTTASELPTKDPALELRRAASASPTGLLVVAADIVKRCPPLAALKAHPPTTDDDAAWLSILEHLSQCLDSGELKGERVVVSGGTQASTMVRAVMAKMGIDRERIEVMRLEDADGCDLDDDGCTYFSVRVDVVPHAVTRSTTPLKPGAPTEL